MTSSSVAAPQCEVVDGMHAFGDADAEHCKYEAGDKDACNLYRLLPLQPWHVADPVADVCKEKEARHEHEEERRSHR